MSSATLKQVSHQEAENESQSQESQNLAVEADEKHLYEDIGALTGEWIDLVCHLFLCV